jgi:hypothetical protein
MMKLILSPAQSIGIDSTDQLTDPSQTDINEAVQVFQKYLDKMQKQDEVVSSAYNNAQEIAQWEKEKSDIVFLGTGAAIPSKYRNGTC